MPVTQSSVTKHPGTAISNLSQDIVIGWMRQKRLKMNPSKPEVMLVRSLLFLNR